MRGALVRRPRTASADKVRGPFLSWRPALTAELRAWARHRGVASPAATLRRGSARAVQWFSGSTGDPAHDGRRRAFHGWRVTPAAIAEARPPRVIGGWGKRIAAGRPERAVSGRRRGYGGAGTPTLRRRGAAPGALTMLRR